MSLSHFIIILRGRWRVALAVISTTVALAVVINLVLPAQYKATASVLVDMRSPDPLVGTVLGSTLITGYMTTQMDVVQSERVVRRAIASLGLEKDPEAKKKWQESTQGEMDFADWLIERTQKKLEVQPTRESGVMSIQFTSNDRQAAAAMANAIVRAYIDTTLELRVEPARQYNDFFDSHLKQLRASLDAAQAKLSTYLQENSIAASDERIDVESLRLSELSSQLVTVQALNLESSSRKQEATANGDRMADVFNHPAVAALNADMSRLQVKMGELRQTYGDHHPQVRDLQSSIESLRAQIAAEKTRVSAGINSTAQINTTREQQLSRLLAEQRAKVLRMKAQRDEASSLQHDVNNARGAYDAVFQRVRQTSLESQITQTNVAILKQARPPAQSASPNLLQNISLALVLGTLLAIATVVVREMRDRRLRTIEDVTEGFRQQLLVVLPDTRASLQHGRAKSLKGRILGSLARPAA